MRGKISREVRVELWLESIRRFGTFFTEEAFIGIPVEKLESAWEDFKDEIRGLHRKVNEK